MKINCVKKISLTDGRNLIQEYAYALLYMISEIILEPVSRLTEINWEECQEAFFFSEKRQLHFYRDEEEKLTGVLFDEQGELNYRDVNYKMAEQYKRIGSKVTVREYLDSDEDGQTVVYYTRLAGIK